MRIWVRCTLLLQLVKTLFHSQQEVGKSQKSLTTALLFLFLQTATTGKAYNNYLAQLASRRSEKTQLQVSRNKLQILLTLVYHEGVCKSWKSLTTMLVRVFLQPAAQRDVCSDCLARLPPVGSWETRG